MMELLEVGGRRPASSIQQANTTILVYIQYCTITNQSNLEINCFSFTFK